MAAVTAMITGGGAAVAASGINADTVDNKHAVGAGASLAGRAGKLVATNGSGYLPNNILLKAPNADKVDGRHAVAAGATPANRAGKLVATDGSGRLPDNIIAKAPDADAVDGVDLAGLWQKSEGVDAATLGGVGSANYWKKSEGVDAASLGTVPPSGYWKKTEAVNAAALGGLPATDYPTKTLLSSTGTHNSSGNPVDWTKLKNVPSTLNNGDAGEGMSSHVQYSQTVAASGSQTVFTHSWSKSQMVFWQGRPTTPGGRITTSVAVEDAGSTFTYFITVTNHTASPVNYEMRAYRFPF